MWRQHLFSARTHNEAGYADGFHILTAENPDDYKFTKEILQRKSRIAERQSPFIMDCGDRFYIGMDGTVPNTLGKDSPYAYELSKTAVNGRKGREISFVHGYFAPKGTKIPDLSEFLEKQPKHLEEILRRANNGENNIHADTINFITPRKAGTDWDRIATEFENGTNKTQGMSFKPNGEKFESIGERVFKEEKSWASKLGEMSSGKKLAVGGGIAAVLLAGGWAASEYFKHKNTDPKHKPR